MNIYEYMYKFEMSVFIYIYTCIGIFPGDDEEAVEDGMVKVFEENKYKLGVTNRRYPLLLYSYFLLFTP
jgi:hypothetical protein